MSSLTAIPAINPMYRLQWEDRQNSHVLLYPEGMIKLNGSAGEILSMVDGERDIITIIAALSERFPEAQGIEKDILEFINEAYSKNWLTVPTPSEAAK